MSKRAARTVQLSGSAALGLGAGLLLVATATGVGRVPQLRVLAERLGDGFLVTAGLILLFGGALAAGLADGLYELDIAFDPGQRRRSAIAIAVGAAVAIVPALALLAIQTHQP